MNARPTTPAQQALIEGIKKRIPDDQLESCIEELKKNDKNVNFLDEKGMAPLHYAIIDGKPSSIKILLEAGANPDFQDKAGNSALHHAMKALRDDLVSLFLNDDPDEKSKLGLNNAAINVDTQLKNNDGDTPLHLYAKRGDHAGNQLLKKHGNRFPISNLYIQNEKQETPLHCAISYDNMYFFTFYIDAFSHNYFNQVDIKNSAILHGPHGDNLVHTAIRRLTNTSLKDNEARTQTMLHLLAGVAPSMFNEKTEATRLSSGYTPAELLVKLKITNSEISYIANHPDLIRQLTFSQRQTLGALQGPLNNLRDENAKLTTNVVNLSKDNVELKEQLATMNSKLDKLTQLLEQQLQLAARSSKNENNTSPVSSPRPSMFK